MSDDTERLVVSMEARIRDFERNMQKAERTGTRSFQQLRGGSQRATRQMEADMVRSTTRINEAMATTSLRIGAFGKAFVGGLVVGASVGALEGIREAAIASTKSVLEMSDSAKRAGISFKAFQELKFVSEQNRIEVDSLTDGLKELSLRADEFIKTGAGSSAEAFKRLGYDAKTLAEKLKEPDQLFLEIIGKLQRLDKAAQIRIADEVFGGTGGEKFVQLISQGEAGIRAQIQAANDLGIVMDEEMIGKAEKVNQAFNVIAATVSTNLKAAVVEAFSMLSDFIDKFNDFEDQRTGNVQANLATTYRLLREENAKLQELQTDKTAFPEDMAIDLNIDKAKERIEELKEQALKLRDILDRRNGYRAPGSPPAPVTPMNPAAEKAKEDADAKKRFLDDRNAEARKTEIDRQIDARAETIIKAAQAIGVSMDKAAAVIQAKSEMADMQSTASASSAAELIKGYEGFRATPYWDVNAYRAGYGSDTVTLDDNSVQRVTSGITVSVTDANRDLVRRVGEFQKGIEGQIGPEVFRSLSEQQQAALTSIAYNYGSLPDRIVAALKGGDAGTVSQAIRGLGSDNNGINKGRRNQEADLYLSDAPQGVQDRVTDLRDRAEAYADLIAKSHEFVAEQQLEGQSLGMTERAAAALRYEQQLLNEARQAGIDLTPDQLANIKALAGEMANAEDRTRSLTQSQEELRQAAQDFAVLGKDVTKGFISDLMNGATAADAFRNALMKIADALLNQVSDAA